MKYLIILLLFITSCYKMSFKTNVSNNQSLIENPTNDIFILNIFNHDIITRMPQNAISTNPIFLDTNTNLVLSYGLTPELYLLDSNYNLDYFGYNIEKTPPELLEKNTIWYNF